MDNYDSITDKFAWGILVRKGSMWIGAHWSPTNKRLCVNFIPFVTIWFCLPGGLIPKGH